VVRAVNATSSKEAKVPVVVPGAPVATPDTTTTDDASRHRLEVSDVALEGSDDWKAWLGGRPHRTFRFTLTNTGQFIVKQATVNIAIGDPNDPQGFVEPVVVEPIDVGESRTFAVPVQFDAVSFGKLVAEGHLTGTSTPVTFRATTSSYPWLLIVIPLAVLVQLVLLFVRNRARRRLQRQALVAKGYDDDALVGFVEVRNSAGQRSVSVVRGVEALRRFVAAPPPGLIRSISLFAVAGTPRDGAEAAVTAACDYVTTGDDWVRLHEEHADQPAGVDDDPLAGDLRGLVPVCLLVRDERPPMTDPGGVGPPKQVSH
jgi:hypothetical protein